MNLPNLRLFPFLFTQKLSSDVVLSLFTAFEQLELSSTAEFGDSIGFALTGVGVMVVLACLLVVCPKRDSKACKSGTLKSELLVVLFCTSSSSMASVLLVVLFSCMSSSLMAKKRASSSLRNKSTSDVSLMGGSESLKGSSVDVSLTFSCVGVAFSSMLTSCVAENKLFSSLTISKRRLFPWDV